ncbi:mitochondrial carrier homolog 2 isoform X2 [Calliopsis andreniformis]|uniref:mitochondrial carrier homolog 2 isoform X2 n=1 Tax=Calliopsis andreniformis TaxID=337506 RepID=UPI003FCD35ED
MLQIIKDEFHEIAFPMFINGISHPIEYAKVLIQIGYEPIPPRPTTTLFRQPALALPNVFQYVKYIKSVDGFSGCYRGLIPKLCAFTVSTVAFKKTSKCIKFSDKSNKEVNEYPSKESGLFRSFVEVYKENGIQGYYAGLAPRLIGNAAVIILVSSSTYVIDKYVITDLEFKPYFTSIINFIVATITYPFLVVSHCMAVNNCGLVAGLPPQMPIYNSWLDCWSHLSATNQLKRGNSLLWRYYTGPQVIINGKAIPLNKDNFHLQSKIQ